MRGVRKGKSLFEKILANICEAQKKVVRAGDKNPRGMLGRSHTPDTLFKMRIARGSTIYVYSSNKSTLIDSFSSSRKAGEYFNVSFNTILKYANNGILFKEKWISSKILINKVNSKDTEK